MAARSPTLRVRINQIDSCVSIPGEFDNGERRRVPIIRVFGTTENGVSACVHVHQVYPYCYVSYNGDLEPSAVRAFTRRLNHALNVAIAVSLKLPPDSPHAQFVKKVLLVKGVDFYGFHSSYAPFFKIYLYNPIHMTRAASILRSGSIMNCRFIVYEAHLSFTLQFMCDFALYGCGWLELGDVFVRGDLLTEGHRSWGVSSHPRERQTVLQLDTCAHQVLNRHVVAARLLHHELRIPAPVPSADADPLISSVRELWEDERRRRMAKGLQATPEMPTVLSQGSRGPGGGWEYEARYQAALRARINSEAAWTEPKPNSWADWVATTFESIDALWDKAHQNFKPRPPKVDGAASSENRPVVPQHEDELVDQAVLMSQPFLEDLRRAENDQVEEEDLAANGPEEETGDDLWKEIIHPPPKSPTKQTAPAMTRWDRNASLDGSPHKRKFAPVHYVSEIDSQTQSFSQLYDGVSYGDGEFTFGQRSSKRVRLDLDSQDLPSQSTPLAPSNWYTYAQQAPTAKELLGSLHEHNIRQVVYRDAYYSKPRDAPASVYEDATARLRFDLRGGIGEWSDGAVWRHREFKLRSQGVRGWEFAGAVPPTVGETRRWLEEQNSVRVTVPLRPRIRSQILAPTQKTDSQPHGPGIRDDSNMSIFALEIFAPSQGSKMPDPESDAIAAVFFAFLPAGAPAFENPEARRLFYHTGIIAVQSATLDPSRLRDHRLETVENELDLLNAVIDRVLDLDPDIVAAWELQVASWSYIRSRGKAWGLDVLDLVGRAELGTSRHGSDSYDATHFSIIRITGRHVLNVWRIMRADMALSSYSFENVMFHVLKRRVVHYSNQTLTNWMSSELPVHNSRVLHYFAERTACVLDILDETETVNKTAEFARVFGIDFFSVISRGSQFKVESFLFRMGKPESFVIMSPSKEDVGRQNAIFATPLILEPQAGFYNSPMVVLDFQSLYPSVMIAYNLCYSTCLGRVQQQNGHWKLGVLPDFNLPPGLLGKVEDYINISPNGLMFVKPEVRPGLLGRMLRELLETRIMVKQAMKSAKGDKGLYRTLDARQLSLKFICNVTYGYTSATFSGRMPAVEIADSIVQTGRETLQKAIATIRNTKKWGAEVVYGDTDSLFIYLPGRTKEQAFRIGYDIADTITAMNPDPIKLKFEKVYLPAVLQSKKRYVGFKYESPDELKPVYDAKGIETVRRDVPPITHKMLETCIKMLFRTQDLSQIKKYCVDSWLKILEERVSVQDFIFAKEVRMGSYSTDKPPPAGVMVAARQQVEDNNNEAQYGDRVKYIIPRRRFAKESLVERALSPEEFLISRQHIDGLYYIENMIIPPLNRVLTLVGVDAGAWFKQMPKIQRIERSDPNGTKTKIDDHFASAQCSVCRQAAGILRAGVCQDCHRTPATSIRKLEQRIGAVEKRRRNVSLICSSCSGSRPGEDIECDSLDCSWFFERQKVSRGLEAVSELKHVVEAINPGDTA